VGAAPSPDGETPAATCGGRRHGADSLPLDLSSFVGRAREVRQVRRLLSRSRLVTLTGIGGVGKTRLALHSAADVQRAFPDGTWLVDLTELHDPDSATRGMPDPELLAQLVAGVLRLPARPMRSPLDQVREALAARRLLLVLDNCEHLLSCCAIVVDAILRACPLVRVLTTSREPLLISGETTFAVPPLAVPPAERLPSPAALARIDSVALFIARARSVLQGFELTAGNQAAVSAICRRLDGLPLAIELAAARVRMLTPQQIMDRLADRFAVLGRGARTAPERLQTLRACLDWSFDLCVMREQRLWARLSVFAGGAELDAVEDICADEDLPAGDVLDVVTALVDKSILIRIDEGRIARYRMLETVRDFGLTKLRAAGREAAVRRQHRDWYLRLAARAQREWLSERQAYWLARLGREHANIRVAVEHCLSEPGGAGDALRIAVSLPPMHWIAKALFREGRQWLDRALALADTPTPVRARAFLLASQLAIGQGDPGAGAELLDRGEALAQKLNAQAELAYATYLRGLVKMFATGDLPAAIDHFENALTALAADPTGPSQLQIDVRLTLGHAAGLLGDGDRAAALEREVRGLTEQWDQGFYRARVVWGRALAAWRNNELDTATALVSERLRPLRGQGTDDRYGIALSVEVLAWIAAAARQGRRAATLLGAADTLWTEIGSSIDGYRYLEDDHRECERRTRDLLGDGAFDAAFEAGRGYVPEQAIALALDADHVPEQLPPATGSAGALAALTRREREVAEHIAQGLTNKEIASRLVISQRTAESHVERILAKLGFSRRAQVAAWFTGAR
jgi:predicted ATPase/DNA-binding CsgD family transcriptional regulator